MDSDEEQEVSSWRGTSATIILINVFDSSKHGSTEIGYIATCRVIRQYLRLSGSRLVGVCLYGTENINSSALDAKSVIDVFPLTSPTLEDFKKLQDLKVSNLNEASELILSDALWHCSKMFANCKKQLSSRTIIILSRLDTPPAQYDQKPSFKRVVDLVDSGIDIQYINISKTDYEVHPFYKNFLTEANKGKETILPKPIWDIPKIEQLMYHQSHRHLAVARLCFEIGKGVNIGVGVYNLVKNSSYQTLKTSNLSRETNDILTNVNKTMKITKKDEEMDVDEETQEPRQVPILKSELLHFQEYGGKKIEFTDNEMKSLKNPFGPPMLKLLGFKPASIMCKEKWYIKAGYFIFPNEDVVEGSTVAFKALHQACTETCTVAICVLCTRVNSKPSFVALSPCTNPLGLQVDMGFDVVKIPFVEDVRNIPGNEEDETEEISEAHKTVMRDILNNIKFAYTTDKFKNPKLQSQYRAVEAIAFEEDEIDPFVDSTKPSSVKFEELTDDLFNELFGPMDAVALKRPKAPRDTNVTNKRAKCDDVDENLLQSRLQNKTIAQYTVPQLKEILKHKNVARALTGMHKNELVELVYECYV